MVHRKTSKRSETRTMLRLADLEQSKMWFSTRSAQRARKNHTVMPSTSLSGGIAPSRVFHSTELLSFVIAAVSTTKFMIAAANDICAAANAVTKGLPEMEEAPIW